MKQAPSRELKIFNFLFHSILNHQLSKIDHHRGPVTAAQVSHTSEVLVTASHDTTVCLWSLETFKLLNTIQLNGPILNIQISSDSVSVLLEIGK